MFYHVNVLELTINGVDGIYIYGWDSQPILFSYNCFILSLPIAVAEMEQKANYYQKYSDNSNLCMILS